MRGADSFFGGSPAAAGSPRGDSGGSLVLVRCDRMLLPATGSTDARSSSASKLRLLRCAQATSSGDSMSAAAGGAASASAAPSSSSSASS